jgi:uncharacterized membrane protein
LRLNTPSANGRWACSYIAEDDWSGAPGLIYLYDTTEKELHTYESETGESPYADAVSDNGIVAGSIGGKAAFLQEGVWTLLPLPDDNRIFETNARGISSDGSLICGYLDIGFINGARIPVLWTRQPDGTYQQDFLPAPAKDYANLTPQAVDPLLISADGSVIAGRVIDYSGFNNLLIVWRKNAENAWEYQIIGEDFIFTQGHESGYAISVYYMKISGNGRYIVCSAIYPDPNSAADLHSPMYFDLQTGEHKVFAFAEDAMAYGMTNEGDLFYATPYMGHTKNTYVIPAGTDNSSIEIAQWIEEQTNNQLDIRSELQAQAYTSTTGRAIPSADGRILVSTFDSPATGAPFSYVVDLNETTAIRPVETPSKRKVYLNLAHETLYFDEPIDRVSISDLSGRIVFAGQPNNGSLSVASLAKGIYLVRVVANNQTDAVKIVVK